MTKKRPYQQPLLTRHNQPRVLAAKATGECALLLVCSGGTSQAQQLSISQQGTNIVVSWPASATNYFLESCCYMTNDWSLVLGTPVTNNQTMSVTLPMTGPQQFFRLKSVKEFIEKDPNEKPPTTDKSAEGGVKDLT